MNIFDMMTVFITFSIFLGMVNILIFFLTEAGETVLNQINKNFYNGKNEKIENIDNILEELWQSIKL